MEKDQKSPLLKIDTLTESQKQAVQHIDGPLLVLAGPGSGKTRVITYRIASLINAGVNPYNICAITFTNKAAEEMKNRVIELGCPAGIHISTFHSLCVRLLRRYGQYAAVNPNFSIYDERDQMRSMKQAIADAGYETSRFSPARMLNAVSQCKNDLETPEEVSERADEFYSKALAKIYSNYDRILHENNSLDFDDLLLKTAFLLKNYPDIRSEVSRRFRYLLVDEYQDTNHAQYQIAKGIALDHANICVTGDPDQSIYRWRGADLRNILVFERDWPDAVVVKLEENFRSTPNILQKADMLIANNKNRKAKTLIPVKEAGPDIEIDSAPDEKAESEIIARKIEQLAEQGVDYSEIAVFYRVNSLSRTVEEALINHRLPYQVVRGVEFYARAEIRDILAYLKLIVNPDDNNAFIRAVSSHPRGIGKTTLEKLAAFGKTRAISLYNSAENADQIKSLSTSAAKKVRAFRRMIESFKTDAEDKVAPLMERVFEESGYLEFLQNSGPSKESAVDNVEELISSAVKYDQGAEEPSLLDYLQTIALYSDSDAYDPESPRVALMTLHAAKGLEFDNVLIAGLEEGLLPHERSMDSKEEIEEERRLLFVGITRARRCLHLSFARHRVLRGQFLRTVPSQFLYEIGWQPEEPALGPDKTEGSENYEFNPGPDYEGFSQVEDEAPFAVNDAVRHKKFGTGRIKEFHNLGPNSVIVVKFNSGKTKSLMLKYAGLKKINA